jgi:hypothetical protein
MTKRSKISGSYNIPDVIVSEAERLGLDATATGGGLDYIYKSFGKNSDGSERLAILSSGADAGSPDRLNEKSDVLIMLSEDWTDQVAMSFRTAKEAMAVMAMMFDPYSARP